jgi:hypothetical protein
MTRKNTVQTCKTRAFSTRSDRSIDRLRFNVYLSSTTNAEKYFRNSSKRLLGLVGYDGRLTRGRCRVRSPEKPKDIFFYRREIFFAFRAKFLYYRICCRWI